MSIPVDCPHCGAFIGTLEFGSEDDLRIPHEERIRMVHEGIVSCNHPNPTRSETFKLFGLIKQTSVVYPETKSLSVWGEYVGPSNKFLLWVAIVFGTKRYPNGSYDGIIVNGKWAWWDPKIGFYGDGVEELAKIPASA